MNPVGKVILWVGGFLVLWALVLSVDTARGHDAGGWKYPDYCCHDRDCAPVDTQSEGQDGKAMGHTKLHNSISLDPKKYNFKLVSPDGKMHVCASPDGASQQRIYYCIFNPEGV